jgi:hypothetical protein
MGMFCSFGKVRWWLKLGFRLVVLGLRPGTHVNFQLGHPPPPQKNKNTLQNKNGSHFNDYNNDEKMILHIAKACARSVEGS